MTNLARRSDYNWRGAEIELLATNDSGFFAGAAAVKLVPRAQPPSEAAGTTAPSSKDETRGRDTGAPE